MKSLSASILAAVVVAGLGAAQNPQSPQAFAGKWDMAVGAPQATVFNRTLEVSVNGTTVTGTMTIGTRTVKLVGEVKDGSMTLRPEPVRALTSEGDELDSFFGSFREGEIQGVYFHRVDGRLGKTGWRAKRPA
jgi:hypothetical protein